MTLPPDLHHLVLVKPQPCLLVTRAATAQLLLIMLTDDPARGYYFCTKKKQLKLISAFVDCITLNVLLHGFLWYRHFSFKEDGSLIDVREKREPVIVEMWFAPQNWLFSEFSRDGTRKFAYLGESNHS